MSRKVWFRTPDGQVWELRNADHHLGKAAVDALLKAGDLWASLPTTAGVAAARSATGPWPTPHSWKDLQKTTSKPPKFTLRRIRLNKQGYNDIGHYYGIGCPLYWACLDDSNPENPEESFTFRARDRKAAKDHIRLMYPSAKFHR